MAFKTTWWLYEGVHAYPCNLHSCLPCTLTPRGIFFLVTQAWAPPQLPVSTWGTMCHLQQCQQPVIPGQAIRHNSNLSRKRVPKSAGINDTIMPNSTDLKFGSFGVRALTGKRVAANTIEAIRRWVAEQ